MTEEQIDDIYCTLVGVMREEFRVPGVENLFADGSYCMNCYREMYAAYGRLRDRLGVVDEDVDVEIIINSLMDMERVISMKMFEYGIKFAQQKEEE